MKVLNIGYFDKKEPLTPVLLGENDTQFFDNAKIDNYLSILSSMLGESNAASDERSAHDFNYVFPEGWQVNLEVEFCNANHAFRLVTQSDNGGGNFADAKMATLRKYNYIATGCDKLDTIQAMARDYFNDLKDIPTSALLTADFVTSMQTCLDIIQVGGSEVNLLQQKHREWLRDYLNYTNDLGGIQVLIPKSPSCEMSDGWLRVSVSGASTGWQDLALAIIIAELASSIFGICIDFTDISAKIPGGKFLVDIGKSSKNQVLDQHQEKC